MSRKDTIQWESEIEYHDDGDYHRIAHGKLVIDGPDGRLVVLKRFRAMIGESEGLMEPGKISEHTTYYRASENQPFTDKTHEWDVPEDVLADREAFLEECRAAVEADPALEYELRSEGL